MQQLIAKEKAKHIRLVIFDIDGVLAHSHLVYSKDGNELKLFHIHDGLGIRWLLQSGIYVGIITGRQSEIVTRRLHELGVTEYIYQGQNNKLPAYQDLKKKLNLKDKEIAYVGDDLPDLPLIRRAGLGVAVANASTTVQQYATWTTTQIGGCGAVREVCEFILAAQDKLARIIQQYIDI